MENQIKRIDRTLKYQGAIVDFYSDTMQMPDGRTDAAEAIQRLIVDNPNKTIFFPDGVYMVSRPIDTPAEPTKSVSLVLGNYAVLKATESGENIGIGFMCGECQMRIMRKAFRRKRLAIYP